MAIDPAKLSPRMTATLLNSTSLGEVASSASVSRQMQAAGLSIGDGKTVNLLRFIAWMHSARHLGKRQAKSSRGGYEQHKAEAAGRMRERSLLGRDIGKMPSIASTRRRDKASKSVRAFCETYGKSVYFLKWSDDHLRVLDRLQAVASDGGQFALAMPRGSGKTVMVAWTALWAMLTGRRKMIVIIGADAKAATQMLDAIRSELETNDLLASDFPEACIPLRRLEGIAQRAAGQLCMGKRTMLSMTADELMLATLPSDALSDRRQSACAAAVVKCVGITGRLRGMQARLPDGRVVRPSLVLLDDPQTDESAKSPSQCDDRERLISGAILGMAGPGETLAALATLTVIKPNDLADRLLTHSRHPDWSSERTKLVYDWGKGIELWEQYASIKRDQEKGAKAAKAFYAANRKAMDEGAKVAWEQRKEKHHLSALQYAWDMRIDKGEESFSAEYQNEPLEDKTSDAVALSVDEIVGRAVNEPRGIVPRLASVLTAGIDVQGDVLYWMIVAWSDSGQGWIIDYGTMPDQPSGLLALASVSVPLSILAPNEGPDAQMSAACAATFSRLLDSDWRVEGGAVARIDAALIDSGWGQHTETIRAACKASGLRVFPAKGVSIGAKSIRGLNDVRKVPGDRVGLHWRSGHPRRIGAAIREYRIDVNFWKSWCVARLRTPLSQPGSLALCGNAPSDLRRHLQLAEQLAAEESITVEAQGKRVEEWRLRRPGLDNHLLDCLVLASVAANMSGVGIKGGREEKEVIVLSQLQAARRRW